MTREEIVQGLKFTIEMFLLEPNTGETLTEPRNDMDKVTIDACKGAIELLEQEPKITSETIQSIIDFLDNDNRYWGETYWEDKNGKSFYTGGFLDGLEGLRDYLKESEEM